MKKRTRSRTQTIRKAQRIEIIQEYLAGDETRAEIWRRYTGQHKDHGGLLRWMRQLGYADKSKKENVVPLVPMAGKKSQKTKEELELRVKELENQLLDSQLKEEAYRRMIDIAEKDLNVSIRKKPSTK